MKDEIKEIIKKYRAKIKDNYIYFRPFIPEKKIKNVLKSYAKDIERIDVYVLLDNTTFGSAKDGAIITDNSIIAHNIMQKPESFEFSIIKDIMFLENAFTSWLIINGMKFLEINFPEKSSMHLFAQMLKDIVKAFNPRNNKLSPVEAIKQLKELFDQGFISEEEYVQKKKKHLDRI